MPHFTFSVTLGAEAPTAEEAWGLAVEAFALEPGPCPDEFETESLRPATSVMSDDGEFHDVSPGYIWDPTAPPLVDVIEFDLADAFDTGGKIHGYVAITGKGISVHFDGYGEKTSDDDRGEPIYIELVGEHPHVVIWGDINEEDPTHTVSLRNAELSLGIVNEE